MLALIARTRGGRRQDRKIQCPTCRTPILVGSEIAYCGAALPEEDEGEGEDEGKVEVEVGGEPGGAAIAPEGRDGSSFDSDEVAVEGSYGSKLEAVVRRTKSILLAWEHVYITMWRPPLNYPDITKVFHQRPPGLLRTIHTPPYPRLSTHRATPCP